MDTQSNTGFSVVFTHIYQDGTREEKVLTPFVENLYEWDEGKHGYLILREYIPLELSFTSTDDGAKCYMDGFDILLNAGLPVDGEGKPYLAAGQQVTLFKYHSNEEYYPYIPGIYCVTIHTRGKKYYSLVKVISNRLTEDQLSTMRKEVEDQLRGLALDVVRKQHVNMKFENMPIDPNLFRQFNTLNSYFSDVSAIVSDLAKRVRYTLKKEYRLQPIERPSQIDEVSIRYRLKHPESADELLSLKKRINYDLPENRMLKMIIEKWVKLLDHFIAALDTCIGQLENNTNSAFSSYTPYEKRKLFLKELGQYRDRAAQMKGALNVLKTCHWYHEIANQHPLSTPNKMLEDIRYRKIWQVSRILDSEEVNFSLHPAWRYQWKRTDQLYEIWGYLQVLSHFCGSTYDFEKRSGWIFEPDGWNSGNLFVIPTIPKGTTVSLLRGDLRLQIVYDGKIPSDMEKTDPADFPVYTTSTNNNPDIRVDVFIGGIFIGAILMDLKYRKKTALSDTMKQLISYADNVRSPYIYRKKRWQRIRPVHQVLVFYPEKGGAGEAEPLSEKSISLIPLTPATDQKVFVETIRSLIEDMILAAEDEGIVLLD
ncbi:DUF2357 domain-containing protein [Weizmannia coagulans]|jgi:hypothetical protein|nr:MULTISPECIES: DUF2357 domain-containing protein [Heyndrickxia]ATW81948.1 DUF2357 domain-containing protein [Heyndrickxia coagulans]AVD57373.1 DUF2357 domain-containing protein [Heyndrickxia coagulans]AWP38326.1 DUF2357 domain-containing protein [Heyndrickxia coagulans]KGB29556.1 hypothetical protein IE89_10145 [Heyndrickxia coagulans]KXT21022.1 hypothetical protein UZ35_06520 [Heyndrickxia coagulans]